MQLNFDSFTINPIQIKDAWSLCDFIISNEARLKRYFPKTVEKNLTPTLSKLFVEKKVAQFKNKEEFLFTLKENETDCLVGLVYLKKLDWRVKEGEFAYCIGYPFEGQKIISKTIKLLSEFAFKELNLNTLQIIVHKDNIASVKVATHNNFKWKTTLENEFTPDNENPLDMELFELYNER